MNLPDESDSEEGLSDEESNDNRDIEEYCKELGIKMDFEKKPEKPSSKKLKQGQKEAPEEKQVSKNALLIEKVIEKAQNEPGNVKNLQIIIKLVRQVFNTQEKQNDEDFDTKDKKR